MRHSENILNKIPSGRYSDSLTAHFHQRNIIDYLDALEDVLMLTIEVNPYRFV